MEVIQMSVNWQLDKLNMVYLQNGMPLGTKKNEVLGKHAEGKKLGTKGHVYDSVYLKCPK